MTDRDEIVLTVRIKLKREDAVECWQDYGEAQDREEALFGPQPGRILTFDAYLDDLIAGYVADLGDGYSYDREVELLKVDAS